MLMLALHCLMGLGLGLVIHYFGERAWGFDLLTSGIHRPLPSALSSIRVLASVSEMASLLASANCLHQPLQISLLHRRRPYSSNSISCLSFRTRPIRATSTSCPSPLKSSILESLKPLMKTTCIGVAAAAALLFSRIQHKPAIASPVPTAAPMVEPADSESHLGEQEKPVDENLTQLPDDVEGLQLLMEEKVRARDFRGAIEVINRLVELEPDDSEWPMLKAQILSYSEDYDSAIDTFEGILAKNPHSVEAFHGLVMAYTESSTGTSELEKRVEESMKQCKKEKKVKELRDFKLLIAQLRVIEGKSSEALKIYQGLAKEEPRDFRPYLCMGIIYKLMEENGEAEKQFDKFRRLIPKNHPYREYFANNMAVSKLFAEKVESQRAGAV